MKTKLGPRITKPDGSYHNIISGRTSIHHDPFYQAGHWLVQRNRLGFWFGYHHQMTVADFGRDEAAALAWLKSKSSA